MYPFPADLDVAVFEGTTVSLVSYSANSIHVAFDWHERLTITAEGSITHEYVDGHNESVVAFEQMPASSSGLIRVIGPRVARAEVRPPTDLALTFEDGQTLVFDGASDMYEMYRITIADREIIV